MEKTQDRRPHQSCIDDDLLRPEPLRNEEARGMRRLWHAMQLYHEGPGAGRLSRLSRIPDRELAQTAPKLSSRPDAPERATEHLQ
jgi:hypothetical protein